MKFTTIYKNGKPDYFFIKLDSPREFALIQPYFLATTHDAPRHGRIKMLECLFSGDTFYGKQSHGYGYSASADVYGEIITIIKKLYKKTLSADAVADLDKINTHDDVLRVSDDTLAELATLNNECFNKKYN
jgi:hypothetical protein